MPKASLCPCGTPIKYESCCGRFHLGIAKPTTAEELMRSRYSAYVKQLPQYIWQTWHPEMQNSNLLKEISATIKETAWTGLNISHKSCGLATDTTGTVTFVASYMERGKICHLKEKSLFVKIGNDWFYKEALEIKY